jgi:hypothetical protein
MNSNDQLFLITVGYLGEIHIMQFYIPTKIIKGKWRFIMLFMTFVDSTIWRVTEVVRSAQRITGGKLPALQDTYTTQCQRKAIKIIKDNNHPSHCLFTPLSSRRRGQYRYIKAGTGERLKKQLLSQGHQTVKQPPLTLSGCCQLLTQLQPH